MTDLTKRIHAINGLDRLWSPEQPLRIIPVPPDERINPFYKDGLRISTVMGCDISPHQNIKVISILGMILDAFERGKFAGVKELIEATSGNTGLAIVLGATYLKIERVTLVIQPDLAVGKREPIEISFGGKLSFVPPDEDLSGIATARQRGGGGYSDSDSWGHNGGVLNLDQYGNKNNALLHEAYTGPEILRGVPNIRIYAGGTGTGGTTMGVMKFLRQHARNDVKALGVLCAPGQKIPGVRDLDRMKEVTLPWRDPLDATVEIDTRQGYLMALWLIRLIGEMFGPSGGFAYAGLLKFFHSCKTTGKPFDLDSLRVRGGPEDGLIPAVVTIPDGFRPYSDHFKSNLPANYLHYKTSPLPTSLLW